METQKTEVLYQNWYLQKASPEKEDELRTNFTLEAEWTLTCGITA